MDEFINAFNSKIDQLSQANNDISSKITENSNFNSEVLKGLTDIDSLVKKINNKILNLKKRVYFLTNEANANSQQLSISQQESSTLSQLIELIKSQKENIVQNVLPNNEEKQAELKSRIAELEQRIADYEKEKELNAGRIVENEQLKNQIRKLNFEKKKLENANSEFEKLKADKDSTSAERDEAKKRIIELEEQIKNTENKIKENENDLIEAQNAHQNAEDYIDKKDYVNQSELNQLQDEHQINLDELENELENVKRDLASTQGQQQRAEQEVAEKQKQYDELYKLHSENVNKITQLQQNQLRLQQIINKAQTVIDETLQNIEALKDGDSNFEEIRNLLKGVLEQLQNMDNGIGEPNPNENQPQGYEDVLAAIKSGNLFSGSDLQNLSNKHGTPEMSDESSNSASDSTPDFGVTIDQVQPNRGGRTRKRKQKKRPKKTKNMKKQKGGFTYGSLKKTKNTYSNITRHRKPSNFKTSRSRSSRNI